MLEVVVYGVIGSCEWGLGSQGLKGSSLILLSMLQDCYTADCAFYMSISKSMSTCMRHCKLQVVYLEYL